MKTAFHYTIALMMLVTGSINTIVTRAADKQNVKNRYGQVVPFSHPFFQAVTMFVGEALCYLVFRIQSWRATQSGKSQTSKPWSRWLLALPAACDMTATSTMYIGLTLTHASDFQMLRGCVVIFTGILSCIFLKRKLRAPHWIGMFLVTLGTLAVGASSTVCHGDDKGAKNPLLGNTLIILAQIVVAIQMVIEEKFISGYNIPALQVVGWEGMFGTLFLSILLVVFYHIPQPTAFQPTPTNPNEKLIGKHRFEDAIDAFTQLGHSPALVGYTLGTVFSIAFFNFSGVSITKHLSAATRMVLDSVRTIVIWAFSMLVKWESFCYMQVIGFVVLLSGTVIFNEIVALPFYTKPEDESDIEKSAHTERLLDVVDGSESPAMPVVDALLTPSMGRATAMKQR